MVKLENISFDHCIKCTVCTIYCPITRVTPLYPGPKQSGPDTERFRIKSPELVDASLQYCNNCKRCEIACPSGVRIADMIQKAKAQHSRRRFRPRDFLLSRTDLVGRPATRWNELVNAINGTGLIKAVLQSTLGIPMARRLPRYDRGTFVQWFKQQAGDQAAFSRQVFYFHGCYVNYNNHELGRDLIRVLNAFGFGVLLPTKSAAAYR